MKMMMMMMMIFIIIIVIIIIIIISIYCEWSSLCFVLFISVEDSSWDMWSDCSISWAALSRVFWRQPAGHVSWFFIAICVYWVVFVSIQMWIVDWYTGQLVRQYVVLSSFLTTNQYYLRRNVRILRYLIHWIVWFPSRFIDYSLEIIAVSQRYEYI